MPLISELLTEAAARVNPWKLECRLCSLVDLTLVGEQEVDGKTAQENDRVLNIGQTDEKQNGPWIVKRDAWVRPVDYNDPQSARAGSTFIVYDGDENSGVYRLTSPTVGEIVPDQTGTSWTKVGGFDQAGGGGGDGTEIAQGGGGVSVGTSGDISMQSSDDEGISIAAVGGELSLQGAGAGVRVHDLTLSGPDGGALTGGRLVAFTSRWVFDDHKQMVFSGDGDEPCVLALDFAGGHVQGAEIACIIHAGEAGSLVVGSAFNATDWDTFDPSESYLVAARWMGGRVVSTGKVLGNPDASAPTVVSATIDLPDPDLLLVEFSEPVIGSTVGLSLTGTARTITTVVVDGTETLAFGLSGAISESDTISLVIGSGRTVQDLNGNRVATGTHSVDLTGGAYEMPGEIAMWRGDSMSVTGGDVFTVPDQIGGFGDLIKGGVGDVDPTTVFGKPGWLTKTNAYVKADKGSSQAIASGALIGTFRLAGTSGAQAIIATGLNGSDTTVGLQVLIASGLLYLRRTASNGGTGDTANTDSDFDIDTSDHTFVVTWTTTGTTRANMYIDGVCVGASIDAVSVAAISRIALGVWPDLSTLGASIAYGEVRLGTSFLGGADGEGNNALDLPPLGGSAAKSACDYLDGSDGGYWA